jgi:hypothetical protein
MPDLNAIATAARKIARERLEATEHLPAGTAVNISLKAGDLKTLAEAVPANASQALRETAAVFAAAVVGIHPETEVAVSARTMAYICAVLPSPPP